ncbi:MAG TPA: peptide deformylase [Acidimicrobiales bacterium]|nr:peptide deformylase [Acidimicrobiales bacterium]
MAPYEIRIIGDPVLRQRAAEVTQVDGALARLCDDMLHTMYEAPGIGLAAPQVGVQKRLFVYDVGEGPGVLVNPVIVESRGTWMYEEGCLSVPGLSWEIERPNEIHIRGYDLDGNEVDIEADELLGRLFQHEFDHLDGILLVERLDDDLRRAALKTIREMVQNGTLTHENRARLREEAMGPSGPSERGPGPSGQTSSGLSLP